MDDHGMDKRQAYAYAHPLGRADDIAAMSRLRADRRHGSGLLLRTILAVDR